MGSAGRCGTCARLPPPLSPGPAGRRAARFREDLIPCTGRSQSLFVGVTFRTRHGQPPRRSKKVIDSNREGTVSESRTGQPPGGRWMQLVIGIICMVMIANLQYGWTLFVTPIDQKYHWGRAAIQVAFSIFVLTETWLVPVEGWFVDRFGPKIVVLIGGILVGIAWAMNSMADTLVYLYIAAAIGGIGAGAVYGTCIGNALKWFPARRGLCAGLTAAGFGAGSALTIIPIQGMIQSSGYEATFLWFGVGQGIVVVVLSLLLKAP